MHTANAHSEIDDDELFAQLEAEIENDDSAAIRERGIQQFKQEVEKLKKLKENGHGRYDEITEEKLVLQTTIEEPLCIIHFYMPNFRRCIIMDKHLESLASKYFSTRFLHVCVENVPFLVEKLGIKVLPAVYCFINGVAKTRLVGFEELGNKDNFETSVLERRLLDTGVIQHEHTEPPQHTYTTSTTTIRQNVRGGPSKDDFEFDL